MSDAYDDERSLVSGLFPGDALEAELRSLRPLPLADRTRQAIARELDAGGSPRRRGVIWRQCTLRRAAMTLALAATAACIAVAVSRIASPTHSKQIAVKIAPVTKPAANRGADTRQFAMAAYLRASAISTDSLNALLDGQAAESTGLSAEFQPRPVLERGN